MINCTICSEEIEDNEVVKIIIPYEEPLNCCFNCEQKIKHYIRGLILEKARINERIMEKLQEVEDLLRGVRG